MKLIYILSLITFIFTGCQSISEKKATIVDSVVEGLEYQCAGFIKYTKADGIATCKHMPIGFKIGEIVLGKLDKIPKDGIIFPQDMVGASRNDINNKNVQKISVILQSLDADNNPENGIQITKATRDKLKIFVDVKHTSMDDIKDIIEAQVGDKNFTQTNNAIEHLKRSMRKYKVLK